MLLKIHQQFCVVKNLSEGDKVNDVWLFLEPELLRSVMKHIFLVSILMPWRFSLLVNLVS